MQTRISPLVALICASSFATALSSCSGGAGNGTPGTASNVVPQSIATQANSASNLAPQSFAMQSDLASNTTVQHWNVQAGASTLDEAFQNLDFYSNTITIDAGDSITWRIASLEPHTISFLAPGQTPPPVTSPQAQAPAGTSTFNGTTFTSSGFLNDAQKYTLTFTKPGTYKYYCLIHQPEMQGTVVVQKAGTPYPHPQSFYTQAGEQDEWVDLNAGKASVALFPFKADGTTVAAGISPGLATGKPASQSTVMRFVDGKDGADLDESQPITVSVGTTVTWINETNNEEHTITFLAGHSLPSNPTGPPAGGSTFDGSTLTSSGLILPGQKYSLTFTKAGHYQYLCLLHHREGMTGFVDVK